MLKLQWFAVLVSKYNWLYAYFKSIVENYVVFCDTGALICWEMDSISVSKYGIWYSFLWMALFNTFESSASFIIWSFFTVTTIGDMKYLSGQLESFMICFSSNNFSSSLLTFPCKLIGMRLTFWCLGWKSIWNLDFATWFFDLPIRDISSGKVFAICSFNSGEEMLLTRSPFWDVDWVTASPSWSNKSRPIMDFSSSATTVILAESQVQPLLVIWDCIFPSTRIGPFEKFRSCADICSLIPKARGLLCTACDVIERLRIQHALPESTSSVVLILPILIGMLRRSTFSTAFSIIAILLSSPLL